ncbi:hypothetical protein AB0N07_39050, partial [Streptomyces sp. NPDC051172]
EGQLIDGRIGVHVDVEGVLTDAETDLGAPTGALAGLTWATYSVALGYYGGQWLGTTWVATAVSVLALFGAGAGAAYVMRRPAKAS